MTWWVENMVSNGDYMSLIAWIFWILVSITLHELAHGWAAIWQGDRTPIHTRHMTANPVVHFGVTSLIMFALCGIAWGAMPVDPSRFRDRRGDVWVSAAGPAMNFLIGFTCLILISLWMKFVPEGTTTWANGAIFFYHGIMLNLLLGLLNLFPIPPLDGSRILAGYSWKVRELFSRPDAPMIGMFIFIAIFFMSPLGGELFFWAAKISMILIDTMGGWFGNAPFIEAFILSMEE